MKKSLSTLAFLFFSISLFFGQNHFQEITNQAGVAHSGNKNMGIAFADFDNDGDEDIYAFTRQNENQLFENLGNGNFENIAPEAGVNSEESTRAAAWGDLNNDGWVDLYIANYQAPDVLYLNNGPNSEGQVTFSDITFQAGIFNENEPISVHLADVDSDGWLDIYVANFLGENRYFRNGGDGTFSDQTMQANLGDNSYSMGCAFFDYDNDGDLDLYLVHDFEVANILYQNDGLGHFTNVAASSGTDIVGHGMGVDVADINQDGWLDMYITDLNENVLLLNNGDGSFTDIATPAGVDDTGMGWSTMFLDFDNDGWPDLYVVNDSQFSPEPNVLYRNLGDMTFEKVDENTAIASAHSGVGGAAADVNGDGFVDLMISNTFSGPGNQLFQNLGNDNHWIGFKLTGQQSNHSAIGTRVSIEYADGQQTDEILAGSGFAGQSSLTLHFGLGENTLVDKVTIRWPNGMEEEYFDLTTDQIHTFTENGVAMMPVIDSIVPFVDEVEKYGKYEAKIGLSADFVNPYDYEQIWVQAHLTGPSGQEKTVDGFFMQDYDLNIISGGLTSIGDGEFRFRFAPEEEGEWKYTISVTDSVGTVTSDEMSFQCTEITSQNNKGFVRSDLTNYLHFDSGDQYLMIGENMAWQNTNAVTNYRNWLEKLTENGGNFFRLWHAHWGLGIEWSEGFQAYEGLRKYRQSNCFYQDWLFDYCAENDVYVMLALQHHGPVSTQVNPNWDDSPYNVNNGGPCQNTWDFFTDDLAREHTRNRYRYIMARWGYARSIMSWELFNEVEWTDNYNTYKEDIQNWHFEMAGFLKTNDPYGHLVTTSYAHENEDPVVWSHPDFDLTQTHHYFNTPHLERALANSNRNYLEDFGKPTLNGEFGLGGSATLANSDPDGIHIHNNLWGGVFSGGAGTGMTWWWDNYIHPRDLYFHFEGVSLMSDWVPFHEKNMAPTGSRVSGAPGDLILTPSLGWGTVGEETFNIDENGNVDPEGGLCIYLYGSSWNTQYRSPPSFQVNAQEEFEFTVRTASDNGQSPKIAIYLNGNVMMEEECETDTEYSILVPPGNNLIKVDNTGTDWVTIASYSFSGIGSKVDSYVLLSDENDVAAGWVLNNEYNHENVLENGDPEPTPEAVMHLEDFANGTYFVKWFDCLTGAMFEVEEVAVTDGQLDALVPALWWDATFLIDENEATVSNAEEQRIALPFTVYPNPAKAGQVVQISTEENTFENSVTLLDMTGKEVSNFGESKSSVTLPADIPVGFYWVKVEGGNKVGTKPLVVSE